MAPSTTDTPRTISSIELISLTGFSLCIGWMCLSFFWIFCDFPPNVPIEVRDLSQCAVFFGMAVGYVALQLLGRKPEFNVFTPYIVAIAFVFAILQPLFALAMFNGIYVQLAIICVADFLSGIGASVLILCWLDVLSRLKKTSYNRFTGLGFVGGSVLFLLAVISPANMQPLFAALYVLASVGLLIFSTRRADGNDERADLEAVADPWTFTKEIEPSFFVFSMVFSLNFIFLFNYGREYVMIGLLAMIPGALVIAILGILKKPYSVTILQRVLLALTVLGCVMQPFTEGVLQLAFSCIVVAAWAAFMTSNYAFIVMKSVVYRDTPLFRQAPARLSIPAIGFALGWLIGSIITMMYGSHSEAFTVLHLIMTVLLVLVVMVFFPVSAHHPASGEHVSTKPQSSTIVSVQMNEKEIFDKRCEAIVKLYQLSPREADILVYLAKGRNAAWIQEELVISPHTVKSHIYNIYRKLDIHSQQKLMSFVESYPLDL